MIFNNVTYAILAGLLPIMLWLWFWLQEDNLHPEPRSLILLSFIGGCIAVIIAVVFENLVKDVITDITYRYIAWSAIEELAKFLAIAFIALRSSALDEPIDAMIYCITVALGFAALENILYIYSSLDAGELTTEVIRNGTSRFFGATLLHAVSSAAIGFMIGITFYKGMFLKTLAIVFGIILATALHASFNLAIINATGTSTLRVFGWVWVAVVILIILFEEVKNIRLKVA